MKNSKQLPSIGQRHFRNLHSLIYIFVLVGSLLTTSSCKKKDKTPVTTESIPIQPAPVPPTFLKIDSTDSNIKITKTNLLAYNTSSQSFDLDGDSVKDISLDLILFTSHGRTLDNTIKIRTLNQDTYVLTDSVYQRTVYNCTTTISNTDINALYPRGLVFNDKMDINDKNWRKGSFTFFYYAEEDDTLYCHNQWVEGYWGNYGIKYVGIKYKNKLGWIKIVISGGQYKVYEYALIKS